MLQYSLQDCELRVQGGILIIDCPSVSVAKRLGLGLGELKQRLMLFGQRTVSIRVLGRAVLPPFVLSTDFCPMNQVTSRGFAETLDFVRGSRDPVCITNHVSHTCLLLNDRFDPERLVWQPAQYVGMNFLWYWRDSMDDFERLMRELKQNGRIENFRYRMRRVDGSMAEYVMDYHMEDDFLGSPARVSKSREWRLLETA